MLTTRSKDVFLYFKGRKPEKLPTFPFLTELRRLTAGLHPLPFKTMAAPALAFQTPRQENSLKCRQVRDKIDSVLMEWGGMTSSCVLHPTRETLLPEM
ncbi:hypothetical protein BaRGS_00002928 [Batillaria attramentaria]|uniref:Uncharacterized protein n=1 Tax=Batillaria attramentaria TaxID=370345 RepID=A0ABD0M217_9CAEN